MNTFSSWHVGVSAEAYAAALFARCGYDVSVQYGANQPEYDLIAVSGDLMLKISVKGSKDGSWGLSQKYKSKNCTYYDANNMWLAKHHNKTIFCLIQFQNTNIDEMPRVYIATPKEIADRLNESVNGRGDTILYENHTWTSKAAGQGTTDKTPDEWKFSEERISEMFKKYGK